MALIIPPGYLQAVYRFTLAGDTEEMVTTMGHEIPSGSTLSGGDLPDTLFSLFNQRVSEHFPA